MVTKKDIILSLVIGLVVAAFAPVILYSLNLTFITFSWLKLYIVSLGIFPLGAALIFYLGALASKFWKPLLQIIKFTEVGTMNTITDFGILNLLIILTERNVGVFVIIFNTVSFSLAVVNSYFWNKRWTFALPEKESADNKSGGFSQFAQFVLITLVGLALNNAIIYFFQRIGGPADISASQWVNISKVLATFVSLIWNFAGYKLIVFRKEKLIV